MDRRGLLHFFKVYIRHVAAFVARGIARGGVTLRLTGATGLRVLRIVEVLACGLEDVVQLGDGRVDGSQILRLVCILELAQRSLDLRALVGRQLVAEILQLLLRLEDHAVRLVDLVDALLLLLVRLGVGRSLVLHAADLVVAQTAGGLDADALHLARALVLGRDVEDTVGVNIERHLDLRHTAHSGRDTVEVETAD